MNQKTNAWRKKLMVSAAGSLIVLSTLAFAESLKPSERSMDAENSTQNNGMSQMRHDGVMMKAMEPSDQQMKSMQETGNIDRDFAMMMRTHHQGSIAMAETELVHGQDPQMRRMAKKIIKDQKREMAQFDKWLSKQPGAAATSAIEGKVSPFQDKSKHFHPRDAK